ncbi:MAG: hypothetical protein HN392_14450 [Anaerolineae bacterium]|jgi:hypothetical protein|nr:hypothetical protein [Anaerolineae bacterium]MBT7783530.1 hypothetical protein [Anaerolineae bacterium]
MMKIARYFLGLIIILVLLGGIPVKAQGTEFRFFNETGHNVQGIFWDYYESIENAETLLGYPITEEFTDRDGLLVQYFHRTRLELFNGQVRQSTLGLWNYEKGVQLSIDNPLACDEFDTGFLVCFAFRDFFNDNNGLSLLGYPISPFEYQENIIVQYFQNGRLEWHPSKPYGQQVVVGNLGSIYFGDIGEDPVRLTGVKPLNALIEAQVLSLNVRAFPWKAVTVSTDEQAIFIVVQDQRLQAVSGASGMATVNWTDGAVTTHSFTTDEKGVVTLMLPVTKQIHGSSVTIDVSVVHRNLAGKTSTSFRIWY